MPGVEAAPRRRCGGGWHKEGSERKPGAASQFKQKGSETWERPGSLSSSTQETGDWLSLGQKAESFWRRSRGDEDPHPSRSQCVPLSEPSAKAKRPAFARCGDQPACWVPWAGHMPNASLAICLMHHWPQGGLDIMLMR